METYDLDIDGTEFQITKDGYAFGDGEHESTRFMLNAICKYGVKDKTVLDIGTGTGILSVLCGKLGAKEILAIDVDEESLKCAEKNFKANNVEVKILSNNLTYSLDGKADIILANLPGPVQHENLLTIKDKMYKDSLLIMTWMNFFPFEQYVKGYEVIEHVPGVQYEGYVLKKV